MVLSMTGYGKNNFIENGKTISVEIRSLNSKQLDLSIKIPAILKEIESKIRTIVTQYLYRGKIDVIINLEKDENPNSSINSDLAKSYFSTFRKFSEELNISIKEEDLFYKIISLPDLISNSSISFNENFLNNILSCTKKTCEDVTEYRKEEGFHLQNDILNRIKATQHLKEQISIFEQNRINIIKERIINELNLLHINENIDKNRFEQELIYYIEKLDITEEKVRLDKHCSYFCETMKNEENSGKKLSFIAQEMGREINTIGSKANDFNIQQLVVGMKDELEKIKEQLANIL